MTTAATEPHRFGLAAAIAAVFCWGIGNVMVREVDLPGLQTAFWRVLLGAVVYTTVLLLRRRSLSWVYLRASLPTGIALSSTIALFFVALNTTTIANAVMISALLPALLLGVAVHRFGESVGVRMIAAVATALVGIGLVLYGSSSESTWSARGDLFAFAALGLMAANFVFAKQARQHVPALQFQTCLWIIGSMLLFPVAIIDAGGVDPPTAHDWLWLAILLMVPGSGHFLMNWTLRHLKLSVASTLTLATPVISTIGAAIFLDESIRALQVVGAAIVFAALMLVIQREAELEAHQHH